MKAFGRGGPEQAGSRDFNPPVSCGQRLRRLVSASDRRKIVTDTERLRAVATDDLDQAIENANGLNREALRIIRRAADIPPIGARSDLLWGVVWRLDTGTTIRNWALELRTGEASETARQVGELGEFRYVSKYYGPQRLAARALILRCQVGYDDGGSPDAASTIVQCSSYGLSLKPLNSDPRIVHGSVMLGLTASGSGMDTFAVMRHDQTRFVADEVYNVELENFLFDAQLAVGVSAEMHAGIAKIPVATGIRG